MDNYTRMLQEQFYGAEVARMLQKKELQSSKSRSRASWTKSSDIQRYSISCTQKPSPKPPVPVFRDLFSYIAVPTAEINENVGSPVVPMLIWETPQVLECLFKFFPVDCLKQCRFVNKFWNRSACSHLRKRSFVNLIGIGKLKNSSSSIKRSATSNQLDLQDQCQSQKSQNIQEFWRIFDVSKYHNHHYRNPTPSPFKKFAISIELIQEDIDINEKIIGDPTKEIIILDYSTDENITFNPKCFNSLHKILQQNSNCLEIFKYTFSYVGSQTQALLSKKKAAPLSVSSRSRRRSGSVTGTVATSALTCLQQQILQGNRRHGVQFRSEFDTLNHLKLPKLNLPALTEFHFFSWSYGSIFDEPTFMKFLSNILKGARSLSKFSTNTDDPRVLNYLLQKNLLRNLSDIYLKKVSRGSVDSLYEASFPKLKSLGCILWKFEKRMKLSEFGELIRNVAGSLKELAVSRVSTNIQNKRDAFMFPSCPKLEKILLSDASGNLGILNEELMPNLKKVYISNFELNSNSRSECNNGEDGGNCRNGEFVPPRFDQMDTEGHRGVEEIRFKVHLGSEIESETETHRQTDKIQDGAGAGTRNSSGAGDDSSMSQVTRVQSKRKDFLKLNMNYGRACIQFLVFLSQQYPNVATFHLTMSTFSKSLVLAVIRFFPNVENLTLESCGPGNFIPEEIFTGMDRRVMNLVVEGGGGERTNLENVKFSLCLTNMKKLKKLVISGFHEFGCILDYLTNNAIQHGVAGILNLEAFHFDWHKELSADVIRRNLAHLSEIVIRFRKEDATDKVLLANLKRLPQLKIIYTSTSEFDLPDQSYLVNKFDFRNY